MKYAFFLFISLYLLLSLVLADVSNGTNTEGLDVNQRTYSESREPCSAYYSEKKAWFGDLHVHTALSQDASTQGTRTRPSEAYQFAKGERLGIQPFDDEGNPLRFAQLSRPLDFAAVTDHAEQIGEVAICNSPRLDGYNSWVCRLYREWPRAAFFVMNTKTSQMDSKRFGFCGNNGQLCLEAAKTPWNEIIQAAENAYDKSERCSFTSFVGYEWTGAQELANTHRNVIFRNNTVPDLPISFTEANYAQQLWAQLDQECEEKKPGCEAVVIPHNSNLSDGFMFQITNPNGSLITKDDAIERSKREPLVEIMQHKGSSECFYGSGMLANDELCGFEQLPYSTFKGKFVSLLSEKAGPDTGFLRETLREGLRQEQRVGANPFKFGFVSGTDTHLGTAGAVSESDFKGHGGAGVPAEDAVVGGLPDDIEFNPGGLTAIWAEENSRDALFNSLKRKEVFATSGPRITVRFFGSTDIPSDLCDNPNLVKDAYKNAVPMGGEFIAGDKSPVFAVIAQRDAQDLPLQQVQIVKGWIDENGDSHEAIYTVAGNPDNGASVDVNTCEAKGEGYAQLCSVWKDTDYIAGQKSWYYSRVVQNPSCRWSQHVCLKSGINCANPKTIKKGMESCCSVEHRPIIQERAWGSPIWVN